jgi:hypothetical protein
MSRQILIATIALVLVSACTSEPDCLPREGFDLGRSAEEPPALCQERAYAEAWQLGQTLGDLERERDELLARADELEGLERMRLRVLQREIPELETLARIQDFMDPATLDDQDETAGQH